MKRCLIIINPSSGKHIIQNKLDRIIGQLTLQNIVEHFEIFYTEKKDDAYYKTRDCDENQYDFIMSVGGDGTLNEVISGMVDSHKKIPLCILAAGTVNDFANYLNIPNSVNGIVEMIKNFNVISSDVGKINNQYFINVAAAGMFSDISFVVSKEEKKKFGPLAYYFKGMTQLPQQLSTNLHLNVTVDDESFEEDAYIMFGKESAGIPEEILVDYEDSCVRIPMLENIRSLNLSNSVAVVLYEALRQQNFKQMQLEGELHRLHWKQD